MIKSWLLVFLLVVTNLATAQEFRNIRLEQRGDFVDITFDLIGVEGRTYTIQIYSTHNNKGEPLEFVTGDVGEGIIPGESKKVVWNANLEVGNRNIEVTITLEGITDAPFLDISSPSGGKFVKGKTNEVRWDNGEKEGRIRIELLKSGRQVSRIADAPNTGSYNWSIPKDFQKGKDYQLTFSDLSNPNQFVTSDYFTIGPQFGMGPLIGGGIGIVGVVVYLLTREKPEDPIPLPSRPDE